MVAVAVIVLTTGNSHPAPAAAPLAPSSSAATESATAADNVPVTTDPTTDATSDPEPSDPAPGTATSDAESDPPAAGGTVTLPDLSSAVSSLDNAGRLDMGTCLSGTLPDSTTATQVGSDVQEVPCFAGDAHYKVIQTFQDSTDLSKCDQNPDSQYAFSSETTSNDGLTETGYVYCLVGLGSFAK